MLNPALDTTLLAKQYRQDERIRIENVLDPAIAEQIREYCLSDVLFEFAHFRNGECRSWTGDDVNGKTPADLQKVQQDIWDLAKKGIGFQYGSYMMRHADKNSTNEKLRFLHSVFDFLNSEEMLGFVTEITGKTDILSADAQYTRYTQGQFLTRHRDVIEGKGRRVAYVIGFSKNWHPDWGGLLQFFEDDGTPRNAWAPQFNCLNLFDIKHIHAVTYVTPFAGEPRLSLTGWFLATPPAAGE